MWISNDALTAFVLVSLSIIFVMVVVGFSMEAYKSSRNKNSNKRVCNNAQHQRKKAPMAVRNN